MVPVGSPGLEGFAEYLHLGFDYFTAAQAGGADTDTLGPALDVGAHGAEIDVPTPPRHVVCVTDDIAK